MDAIRQAIYTKMAADSTLTTALSTYRSTYAIVDGFNPPDDMQVPFVVYDVMEDRNIYSKTDTLRVVRVDFRIVTSTLSDPTTIAERIRTLFHRVAITVSGWTNIITEVIGPRQIGQTESTKTNLITIEFTLA